MKYCHACKHYLPENSRFCNLCGGKAQENLPEDLSDCSSIVTFAKMVRRDPSLITDHLWLTQIIAQCFPDDRTRGYLLEQIFRYMNEDMGQYLRYDDKIVQNFAYKATEKCECFKSLARQAILDWAFVYGRISLANYKKWTKETALRLDPSEVAAKDLRLALSSDNCQPGKVIRFGHYPQDFGLIPQPIDWLVLAREDNTLFVIAKRALDCQPFHDDEDEEEIEITWASCSLRKWLNHDFLSSAFTAEEQALIKLSHLRCLYGEENGTEGGLDTDDFIFLLSIDEVAKYLAHGSNRHDESDGFHYDNNVDIMAPATPYATNQGAYNWNLNSCQYFLRSPGFNSHNRVMVGYDTGAILTCCSEIGSSAIRPAMRIFLPNP